MNKNYEPTACTTLLIGKGASADGSTIIARTEDSPNGAFNAKKMIVVKPSEQPRQYQSTISKVVIDLPEKPIAYTATPDADETHGIWGEAGINADNIAMSATETITTNARVLGADPLIETGIGEEDMLTLVLPYIHSAREGVRRLGDLLERYGTYEMNGIAFSDVNEIWFLETIGGHHWLAQRVPDDMYVTVPNQRGIEKFDLNDQDNFMASADMTEFINENQLQLDEELNSRIMFGTHTEMDHVYNTPRAWAIQKMLTPQVEHNPMDDDIPFAQKPEHKLTIEDVHMVMSNHYQGTVYDPYGKLGDETTRNLFRPIGINRNCELSVLQLRPNMPLEKMAIQWLAYSSMPFTTLVPVYTRVLDIPEYYKNTTVRVTSESYYWANRLIAAMADANYSEIIPFVERYQLNTLGMAHQHIHTVDQDSQIKLEDANQKFASEIKEELETLLNQVLLTRSNLMQNGYSRSDN
ncbi:C69 family dipeptidase [Weissella coleopterorum]|uniref:Dipeptidase n=1 Tax=Weissella coleopterorum TaxID=2714949 RepID=A0A6G8B1Z9_9LACO|nr:C69 family dipeptidase [Weissella coleopterorum]QIL51239.1 C69 family dipeptidase [Weissella coleopterorum]